MAALVAGVQYGLSSQSNFHENKSLIFVKLTDSAQRAIEEYLRNRNNINQSPTVQFIGNEGQLCFPSTKSSYGNFTFSLSHNQDIEGPQGGFECVQQTGPTNLESLGTLPYKMRIQANDDVYETTRHRMHVAEENNKNKCTRVIKTNEPIGRKIKVKGTVRTFLPSGQPTLNMTSKSRDSSSTTILSSQQSNLSSAYKSQSNYLLSNRSQSDSQKKFTDVMRRPLKERLIHLLALRPFKRPEIYDRINREGIREKEKNSVATVLKDISFMRDNTYHLHRNFWNDVQEDWPSYTEQEKTMLKRRKPQNLTPPGSSDGGSSGSGQSPNSTHPGSPPSITSPPSGLLGSKRPGYYQGSDGLPTKRQRISHYRKSESSYSINESGKSSAPNVSSSNCWDQKQHQEQRYQNQQQRNSCSGNKFNLAPCSDGEEVTTNGLITLNKLSSISDVESNNKDNCNKHSSSSYGNHHPYQCQQQSHEEQDHFMNHRKEIDDCVDDDSTLASAESNSITGEKNVSYIQKSIEEGITEDRICRPNSLIRSNYCSNRSNHSEFPDVAVTKAIGDTFLSFSNSSCVSTSSSENFRGSEYPDYLTSYTMISSSEQRTRYKAEFNAYYKEYRKLHVQVVKISKQFSHLEEELRKKLDTGNTEESELIKHEILQEYAKTKDINARFYYLHDKLGHIKKLVSEYDAQIHTDSTSYNNGQDLIIDSDLGNDTFNPVTRDERCDFTQFSMGQEVSCTTKMPHFS